MTDYVLRRSDFNMSQTTVCTGSALECVEKILDAFPNVVVEEDADYPGCFDAFAYNERQSFVFSIQPLGFKLK